MDSSSPQVTEALLLSLTECKSMAEIAVLSLRSKSLTFCLRPLSQSINLKILYLQNNRLSSQDLSINLGKFKQLMKLDLSFN